MLLRGLADSVSSADATLVVSIIPDEIQVSRELRQAALGESEDESGLDMRRPQRRLLEICDELSLLCVDLLPAFQAQADSGPLYRLRNTHWNPRGNTLAAETLASELAGLVER